MSHHPAELRFPDPVTGTLVVRNVHVVPMDSPGVLEDQTVVVEDGRITALGPSGKDGTDARGDPPARVLDGKGKYLVPGLADMHVHLWERSEIALYLANGVTTVRNMSGHPMHLKMRSEWEHRAIPGPRMITTGPVIDGPGWDGEPFWPGTILLTDPEEADRVVHEVVSDGYDQIKVYQQLSAEGLRALGRAARDAGVRMVGHCPQRVSFEEAIGAGMTCFEHLRGVGTGHLRGGRTLPRTGKAQGRIFGVLETMKVTAEHLDLGAVRILAEMMASEDIWSCPTLAVHSHAMTDREALASREFDFESKGRLEQWRTHNRLFRDEVLDEQANEVTAEYKQALSAVVQILHQAGAPLLAGTDPPNPFVFPGAALHDELQNFMEAGLSPFEAIECSTAQAARFMGEEGRWGVIAPGARADMLLVSENPLRDVAVLRSPEAVFVNGFHLSRADLQSLLEQRKQIVRG